MLRFKMKRMIVGDTRTFAVESMITEAYAREGLRALGCFVIYVGGERYGVYETNATLLANSFDEVTNRIDRRGLHDVPSAAEESPGAIADAFRETVYSDEPKDEYFGIPRDRFRDYIYSGDLLWAPDGDEAFDDGSYVLQFDVGDRVRLIAFRCGADGLHDPITLRDTWIAAADYYRILTDRHDAFENEWKSLPKREIWPQGDRSSR